MLAFGDASPGEVATELALPTNPNATVPHFLPLLAERFAKQRLQALARVEGQVHDGKPVVLFLCTHNAGRSQMALGWFTQLAGDRAIAWSGGSEPAAEINPAAVEAMAEVGINIADEYPQLIGARARRTHHHRPLPPRPPHPRQGRGAA